MSDTYDHIICMYGYIMYHIYMFHSRTLFRSQDLSYPILDLGPMALVAHEPRYAS